MKSSKKPETLEEIANEWQDHKARLNEKLARENPRWEDPKKPWWSKVIIGVLAR